MSFFNLIPPELFLVVSFMLALNIGIAIQYQDPISLGFDLGLFCIVSWGFNILYKEDR